jgi:proteic killer suppression protein
METQNVFEGRPCRRFRNIRSVLERKLAMLDAAHRFPQDLQSPPGNHLEKLSGNLAGKHSIRVNDQYRLVFTWTPQGPAEVICTDYH